MVALNWSTISLASSLVGSLATIGCESNQPQHATPRTLAMNSSGGSGMSKGVPQTAKPTQSKLAQPRPDPDAVDWGFKAERPLPTTRRSVTALDAKTLDTPVADGELPLVYLVGSEGIVNVRNLRSKQLLATAPVSHNSTVAVDARRGVIVDGNVITSGPLAASDRYGIFYSVAGVSDQYITGTETNDPDILRWHHPAKNSATQPATRPASVIRP